MEKALQSSTNNHWGFVVVFAQSFSPSPDVRQKFSRQPPTKGYEDANTHTVKESPSQGAVGKGHSPQTEQTMVNTACVLHLYTHICIYIYIAIPSQRHQSISFLAHLSNRSFVQSRDHCHQELCRNLSHPGLAGQVG